MLKNPHTPNPQLSWFLFHLQQLVTALRTNRELQSNNDGNGNENLWQKSIRFKWAKQQLYTCLTLFVHFFAITVWLQHETAYIVVIACFMADVNTRQWLLFSIYVNDLPAVSAMCSSACYVDDMKLILSFTVEESHATVDKVNDGLLQICVWCFENYLLLNADKTKLRVFWAVDRIKFVNH